jgi:hypothetical protein
MASNTLCARSTVFPRCSSRETWASLTPTLSANSLWLGSLAILMAMSRGTYRAQVADDPEVPPTHTLVPFHLFLELARNENIGSKAQITSLENPNPSSFSSTCDGSLGRTGRSWRAAGVISAARGAGMGPEELHFFVTEPE